MDISKAIRINTAFTDGIEGKELSHLADAIKLGIEALQRVKAGRTPAPALYFQPLPGETPEV